MTVLESIQDANPNVHIQTVTDPAFALYGQVVHLPYQEELEQALVQKTTIPAVNNQYVRDDSALLPEPGKKEIARLIYGEQPIEVGYCNGNSDRINAFEFHNCSEVNLAATDLILFLAHRKDLHDNTISTHHAQAFLVPKGTAIEVYPTTLHFAPCRVWNTGFKCLVILTDQTNTDLADGRDTDDLLFQFNKWLVTHPDNQRMVDKDAVVGLTGENTVIQPIKQEVFK